MRVSRLRRHPVKAMAGEVLDSVAVDDRGLVGDRWYAVVDDDGDGLPTHSAVGLGPALPAAYTDPTSSRPPPGNSAAPRAAAKCPR